VTSSARDRARVIFAIFHPADLKMRISESNEPHTGISRGAGHGEVRRRRLGARGINGSPLMKRSSAFRDGARLRSEAKPKPAGLLSDSTRSHPINPLPSV